MALTLDSIEKAIMDAVETYIQAAFLEGTAAAGSQFIQPMPQFGSEVMTKNGGEFQVMTKAPFKAALAALLKALRSPAVVSVSSYGTGWEAGAGLSYTRNGIGEVCLQGSVKAGAAAAGSTIFSLPAGYRPSQDLVFLVPAGSASFSPASVTVKTTGDVIYNGLPTLASFVHLTSVRFRPA